MSLFLSINMICTRWLWMKRTKSSTHTSEWRERERDLCSNLGKRQIHNIAYGYGWTGENVQVFQVVIFHLGVILNHNLTFVKERNGNKLLKYDEALLYTWCSYLWSFGYLVNEPVLVFFFTFAKIIPNSLDYGLKIKRLNSDEDAVYWF